MAVKKLAIWTLIGGMGLSGAGCATNTETGALVGGGTGAAVGAALFGRAPLAGAVLGGAFGALTGAAIGNAADRDEAYREGYYAPPPPPIETAPPPPYPGARWHPGYWVIDRGAWLWVSGYWS